jgi:hypothetical protein
MKIKLFILSFLLVCIYQDSNAQKNNQIIIEGQVPSDYDKNTVKMYLYPVHRVRYISGKEQDFSQKINNGKYKFSLPIAEPMFINTNLFGKIFFAFPL